MLNKYFLVVLTENLSGGVSQTITPYDTYKECESKWRDALSKTGGNPQTAYAIFEILDMYGRSMQDNYYVVDNTTTQYVAITDATATAEEGVTYYVFIDNQYVADTGVEVGDRVFGKYVVAE
jgi:hypothetical protein